MSKYIDYETKRGIRYCHVDKDGPTIWKHRAEFGALLSQLYADAGRDSEHYDVAGFVPNIADAFVSNEWTFNPYATVLHMTLFMLDKEVHAVAPIHDMAGRDEIGFEPSATLAQNMQLSSDREERKRMYLVLASKIRKQSGQVLSAGTIADHFESAKEKGYFEPAKTIVDWLYATLFHALSNEQLMKSPMRVGDIERIEKDLLLMSYSCLATIIEAGEDRSVAQVQKKHVIANLDTNKYLLSLPYGLEKNGEKPVLITR